MKQIAVVIASFAALAMFGCSDSSSAPKDQIACTYTNPMVGDVCIQGQGADVQKEGCPTEGEEAEDYGTFKSQGSSCKAAKGSCVMFDDIDEETGEKLKVEFFYYETAGAMICEMMEQFDNLEDMDDDDFDWSIYGKAARAAARLR